MRVEWACSTCGDVFTRKSNCERHINGKNIHAGVGNPVPVSVYPYGGKRRRHSRVIHPGEGYRNDYYYDNYSHLHAQPVGPLGAGGNYAHGNIAAGPHQRNRPTSLQKKAERWELLASIAENMEKVFKSFSLPAGVAAAPQGFPTKMVVGRMCDRCLTIDYLFLPNFNTGDYDVNSHVCNRDNPVDSHKVENIREKILPQGLKQTVDMWLAGYPKYLVAHRISSEQLSALPATIRDMRVIKIDAAEIENNGHRRDSEGGNDETGRRKGTAYIIRAIQSSGRSPSVADDHGSSNREEDLYGWVALTDDEIVDFLGKARATAMVYEVFNPDGNGNNNSQQQQQDHHHYYYLEIIPPYEIEARQRAEQNAMIKSMIKEMSTEMVSELKEEEMNDSDGSWENYFSKRQQEQPMAGAGNNNNSAQQHNAQNRHYAIQDILDGTTEKESWYLGIEIEEGVTRIWGFPGVSADMMKPKSQEQGNGGRRVNHQDDENKCQVCYGLEYPSRTMSSFLLGLFPLLEDVELDMKGNGAIQDNNSNPFSFARDKGLQIIRDNGTCKIESIKPNEIIFTIPKRKNYSWKYFGLTKSFAGRYRLLLLSNGENNDRSHGTRPATNRKKLWALSRVA
jgi:hypothetical protein